MQESEVAGYKGGATGGCGGGGSGGGGAAARARLEDVEGAAEEEGELQGRAQRGAGVGCRVEGGEDGYVEGVVLQFG